MLGLSFATDKNAVLRIVEQRVKAFYLKLI